MEEHGDSRDHDTPEHWPGREQAGEADGLQLDVAPGVGPMEMGELLLLGALLEETLRFDLEEFQLENGVVLGETA